MEPSTLPRHLGDRRAARRVAWPSPWDGQLEELLVGTPSAVLRLHRLFRCEALLTLILLASLVLVFLATEVRGMPGALPMLLNVAVTYIAAWVKFSFLNAEERRCRLIVQELSGEPAIVAEALAGLLHGRLCKNLRHTSFFLSLLYIFSMCWLAILPPCTVLVHDFVLDRVVISSSDLMYCRAAKITMPGLLICNSLLVLALNQALRYHDGSAPPAPPARGVPRELLELLPCHEVGSPGPPPRDEEAGEPACAICLEDFFAGARVKRLPCGHEFHADCADDWLSRAASCPMRCPGDLVAALGGGKPPERSKASAASAAVAALVARAGLPTVFGRPARGAAQGPGDA